MPRHRADARPADVPATPRLDLAARLVELAAQVAADGVALRSPTLLPPTDRPSSRDGHEAPAPPAAPSVLSKPAAAGREPRAAAPAAHRTLVQVTIGRVDVRAAPEPAPPRPAPRPAAAPTSLDTYLARRNGTER